MCSVVYSAMISCRHFNVSIGRIDGHTGKNSIFLPDELLNHLGTVDWMRKIHNYFTFFLSFISCCLSGHQNSEKGIEGVSVVQHRPKQPKKVMLRAKRALWIKLTQNSY